MPWRRYRPKELTADHMQMRVRLALHAVSAEVGEDSESVGAMLLARLRRKVAHVRHQIAAAPQFGLRHVCPGNDEYLHGHPVELVVEDDDAVVFVVDSGRFAVGDDFAEDAVGCGHGLAGRSNAVVGGVDTNELPDVSITYSRDSRTVKYHGLRFK